MERLFTWCLPIEFTMLAHVSECAVFSPNCSSFAVECNSNSKFSQNERNLCFLLKKLMGFSGENLDFSSKIVKYGKLFVEYVSNGIISWKSILHLNCEVSWLKIRKIWKFEKLKNMTKKRNISKKKFSPFQKACLQKWNGGKYAGGTRPSC